jgi:hypothetical protein
VGSPGVEGGPAYCNKKILIFSVSRVFLWHFGMENRGCLPPFWNELAFFLKKIDRINSVLT